MSKKKRDEKVDRLIKTYALLDVLTPGPPSSGGGRRRRSKPRWAAKPACATCSDSGKVLVEPNRFFAGFEWRPCPDCKANHEPGTCKACGGSGVALFRGFGRFKERPCRECDAVARSKQAAAEQRRALDQAIALYQQEMAEEAAARKSAIASARASVDATEGPGEGGPPVPDNASSSKSASEVRPYAKRRVPTVRQLFGFALLLLALVPAAQWIAPTVRAILGWPSLQDRDVFGALATVLVTALIIRKSS